MLNRGTGSTAELVGGGPNTFLHKADALFVSPFRFVRVLVRKPRVDGRTCAQVDPDWPKFSSHVFETMKIRLSLLSLLFGLAVGPALFAQDGPKEPTPGAEKEPETELGKKMEKISRAYKKLRREVSDATKNEDSLAQVAIIRENTNEALKLEPAKKADVPADAQEKFVADYHSKMKEFVAELDVLEAALKAGKNDEAAKAVEELGKLQKSDHKEFRRPPAKK